MSFAKDFLSASFPVSHQDKMKAAAEQMRSEGVELFRARSNTTVFALKYDAGLIMAGDRRISDGWMGIVSDYDNKIDPLTKFSAMATAGYCNVGMFLIENMQSICITFNALYEKILSPEGQANFLRALLEIWWFFSVANWYWAVGLPVLGCYDVKKDKPRIFSFDADGYFFEAAFLAGAGCGFEKVEGLLKNSWSRGINKDDAIALAMRAMSHSRDGANSASTPRMPISATISAAEKSRVAVPPA